MNEYTLNLDNIQEADIPDVVKKAAKQLQTNTYLSVGAFLGEITDDEIELLFDLCENSLNDQYFDQDLILLTCIFLSGEGQPVTEDAVEFAYSSLIGLITLEYLYRRDMIIVERENWSVSEDYENKTIARKKLH